MELWHGFKSESFKFEGYMSYGTNDAVVPYHENGQLMEEKYTNNSDLLVLIPRDGEGHHPHGVPSDPQKITEHILRFTK